MDRALDERLVLIVKPKPGAAWGLPESAWQVRRLGTQARSFGGLAVDFCLRLMPLPVAGVATKLLSVNERPPRNRFRAQVI